TPPTGRPKSIATMISAAVDAVAAGPASTSMAGASAVTGRNTWTLSMKFPTTPARRAARPAGGREAGTRATGAEDAALIDPPRPAPCAGRRRPRAWGGAVTPARRTPARGVRRADGRGPPRPGPRGSRPPAPARRPRAHPPPPRRTRDRGRSPATRHRDGPLRHAAARRPPAH